MKPVYFLLNDEARNAPVCRLRLDHLTEVLESTGFLCIGDLLKPIQGSRNRLHWICGLDPQDAKHLSDRVELLRAHIDRNGNVAWHDYHAACGGTAAPASVRPETISTGGASDPLDSPVADDASLVPSFEIASGADFIRAFPEVIEAIVRARAHPVDRAILVDRLSRQPSDRMTLDQIASSVPVRITRERVRQRETKILLHISNALIHGRQRSLGVQFRPSFTEYWRAAAVQFGGETEITFARFLQVLSSAWNVPAEQLFAHLPLITSVLTSRATVPDALRAHMRRDSRFYQELSEADAATPVTRLALGKVVDSLLADGIETVRALFDAARAGRGPDPRSAAGRVVEKVLSALVAALGEDGQIDWSRYESELGLLRLPAVDPSSISAFLATLIPDLEAIIHANHYSLRALDIFRLRIAVAPALRATLAQTADRLGTHGPSIKREESTLLSGLNDHLVARDLTRSVVSVSPVYLAYWADAADIYGHCGGTLKSFRELAISRWKVSLEELDGPAEILWAVLSQYPAGRPRGKREVADRAVAPATAEPTGTVVLRGFQRVH